MSSASGVRTIGRGAALGAEQPIRAATSLPNSNAIALQTVVGLLRAGDLAAMAAGGIVAHVAMPSFGFDLAPGSQAILTSASFAMACTGLHVLRAYRPAPHVLFGGGLARRWGAFVAGALAAGLYAVMLPDGGPPALAWPLLWLVSCFVVTAFGQAVLMSKASQWLASGRFAQRVAVVGLNEYSARFLERVRDSGQLVTVAGLYRDGADSPLSEFAGQRVAGRVEDIVAHARQQRIDAVVLAMPLTEPERITQARSALRTMVADIYVTAGMAGLYFAAPHIQDVATNPVVNISPCPLAEHQALRKAVFDRVVAAMLLLALLPILLLIALLIKSTSPGPALFSQPRLGFNNVMFRIYKFRTMYHADADLLADRQTTRGDLRITPLGRILRKLSLDELPQLLNVLAGNMSLVGPRPHAPNTKAGDQLFHEAVEDYALRHRVKPGITGWAQVNGWRGETRTVEQLRQRVAHDLYYIENWSLAFDVRIILLTVRREIASSTAF